MHTILKWSGAVIGALLGIALLGAGYIYFASQAMVGTVYTPRAVAFHAPSDAASIARGRHLTVVAGCTDCHAAELTGRRFDDVPDASVWSRNLTLLSATYSDADFERVIRQGIKPDGTSVIIMPSNSYATMSDRDLGDVIAYLRSLKSKGEPRPAPHYGLYPRLGLLLGKFATDRDFAKGDKPSLDLGPKFAEGRRIAGLACAECHNTDFAPRPDAFFRTPDLSIVAAYERADFIHFMRTGKAAGGRELPVMSDTARLRFAHFSDAEVNALYDYLAERGRRVTQ